MSGTSHAAQESVARRPQAYPRKRAIAACQLCRNRRTKCDNLRPSCSACLKLGVECITNGADYSTFDPASLQILDRLGTLETLVRSLALHSSEAPREREQRAKEAGIEICGPLLPSLESLLKLPVFDKISHLPDQTPTAGMRSTSSESPLQLGSRLQSTAILTEEPQEMNNLVECYFEYVHVKNPILSERLVRQAVSSVALNGINWSSQSCLALLICALGSISGPFGPDSPLPGTPAYAKSLAYFAAAERRLGPLFSSEDVMSAQCVFLAGVYAMTMFQPRQALRFFLQALLISEQLLVESGSEGSGFIRSKDSSQALSMRQAIYWSSWKSVVELDAALGSSSLKLGATGQAPYPSFYPTPPSPNTSHDNYSEVERGQEISWYFYLAEISLKRLHARLCMELNTLKEQSSSPLQLLRKWVTQEPLWEHEVREWINSLPEALSFSSPSADDDICRFVLRGHVLNVLETIYWPFTSLPFSNAFTSIAEMGHHILVLLQKGMSFHNDQIQVNQPGFRHRHHGTFFMIQACTRSSLALVAYANLRVEAVQLGSCWSIQMPLQWRENIHSVLDVLQYWAAEFPALTEYHKLLGKVLLSLDLDSAA